MRFERPLLLALQLLCAGCAGLEGFGPAPRTAVSCKAHSAGSNTADCQIALRVVETGSKCKVEFVDPRQADVVFQSGRPNLWVLMQLENAAAGYRFPKKDGVVVRNDPFNNFRGGHTEGAQDETFAILNVNSRAWGVGDYEYAIRVTHAATGRNCDLDPWYRNR